MIIKNIAPYPKEIKALNISLLPGQDADISQFSARERQSCFELQEAFRKGEVICIGVGKHDREAPSPEARAQRAFSQGTTGRQPSIPYKTVYGGAGPLKREFEDPEPLPLSQEVPVEQRLRYNQHHREIEQTDPSDGRDRSAFAAGTHGAQPLVKVKAEHAPSLKDSEITHRRHETPAGYEKQIKHTRTERGGVTLIDKVTGIVEQDAHGVRAIRPVKPIPILPKTTETPAEETTQLPTISRERARQLIMASRCVGICSNGRQCRRRPVTGYEYCVLHMSKELLEEYKHQKKQSFLKK